MKVHGIGNLTAAQLHDELCQGARFVFYEYCISIVFVTLRRPSRIWFLRPGQIGLLRGLPYTLLSLLLGWWGLPWGIVYTPLVVFTNFSGGCDVTAQVWALLPVPQAEETDSVDPRLL